MIAIPSKAEGDVRSSCQEKHVIIALLYTLTQCMLSKIELGYTATEVFVAKLDYMMYSYA